MSLEDRQLPQAWTSEHSAVRALAALGITHPREFSRAFSGATGLPLGVARPESFRREDKRTDLWFETVDGGEVLIEAKIDDFVTLEQIDGYCQEFPEATAIMLVPSDDADDVRAVLSARESVRVATWSTVLTELARTNPIADQVFRDVRLLADPPGSKRRVRRLMRDAVRATSNETVRFAQSATSGRLPSIDVWVDDTWVFGQVEATRSTSVPPKFQATVGFQVGVQDVEDEGSRRRMHDALAAGWRAACDVESAGRARLSRSRACSPQQATFSVGEPFQARGYRGSHVGVATAFTTDATEALRWAVSLAEVFVPVSLAVWGCAAGQVG